MTYRFLDEIEKHEGFKIHRAAYQHWRSPGKTGFDALTNWKRYLPNRVQRICTVELKINVARRYLRPLIGTRFEQFIGFRADEANRVSNYRNTYKNTVTRFPLYEQGITKDMVNDYWSTKPYTLEIPAILGNCDLCFLKGKNSIIKIMAAYPELADKWIEDERRANQGRQHGRATFFKDTTYEELLRIAVSQKREFDLNEALPAYSCACA